MSHKDPATFKFYSVNFGILHSKICICDNCIEKGIEQTDQLDENNAEDLGDFL